MVDPIEFEQSFDDVPEGVLTSFELEIASLGDTRFDDLDQTKRPRTRFETMSERSNREAPLLQQVDGSVSEVVTTSSPVLRSSRSGNDNEDDMASLREALLHYWGYDSFRPLQAEAMRAVIEHRDSVVVLPTGGGKSICFQAPAVTMQGLAVVVSPLISLMKDQVDALIECGIEAACVNSSLPREELFQVANRIRRGELRLLYVAPERLCTERMLTFLEEIRVSFFAIDEAHCISAWGHDFRPEYRQLRQLRSRFPNVGVHAYTATATQQVRDDIIEQLGLSRAEQLIGSFDRPNLTYRVVRKNDILKQVRQVIDSHPGESGIIYCISRREVDELATSLAKAGYRALPYHAGMPDFQRHKNQDDFLNDRADVVVATVAFGMGIDKSDVRYVIHTGSPKSLEHYQQETGRAGRDGLDAECWLFWNVGNFVTWRRMLEELPPDALKQSDISLRAMERFCNGVICRHRALVEHFGQSYPLENCGACDVCLEQIQLADDAKIISQKILSCVVRLKEGFGAGYVAQVLTGSKEARILENGHDQLSTYGLLSDSPATHVRDWIEQLTAQGYLARVKVRGGEFEVLSVTPLGWKVLKENEVPRLLQPARKKSKSDRPARSETTSWEGVDRVLFDHLRTLRRNLAAERNVPPFVVFADTTLRDLAKRRPTTLDGFRKAHGVGDKKTSDYGEIFTRTIRDYCVKSGLEASSAPTEPEKMTHKSQASSRVESTAQRAVSSNLSKQNAFDMFSAGQTIEEIMSSTNRARSTILEYLAEYIDQQQVSDPAPWVDPATFRRICMASRHSTDGRLKPIFDALGGQVSYDMIRIALACARHLPPEEFALDTEI